MLHACLLSSTHFLFHTSSECSWRGVPLPETEDHHFTRALTGLSFMSPVGDGSSEKGTTTGTHDDSGVCKPADLLGARDANATRSLKAFLTRARSFRGQEDMGRLQSMASCQPDWHRHRRQARARLAARSNAAWTDPVDPEASNR